MGLGHLGRAGQDSGLKTFPSLTREVIFSPLRNETRPPRRPNSPPGCNGRRRGRKGETSPKIEKKASCRDIRYLPLKKIPANIRRGGWNKACPPQNPSAF